VNTVAKKEDWALLATRVDSLDRKVEGIDDRMNGVENKMEALEQTDLRQRMKRVEQKLGIV